MKKRANRIAALYCQHSQQLNKNLNEQVKPLAIGNMFAAKMFMKYMQINIICTNLHVA